jgi:dihydroorotate dehydrogenase electron transfer subunit
MTSSAVTARAVFAVEASEQAGRGVVRIGLVPPPAAVVPRPGQFYSVRCGASTAPLLRRPFSVHRVREVPGGWRLDLLVRIVGPGTRWLGSRAAGDRLDVIGPLGNGFDPDPETTAVLVGRGIGIAPLYALGEALRGTLPRSRLLILMGARLKERIFLREELSDLGVLHLYTDDGSEGFRGRAPDLLHSLAEDGVPGDRFAVYACGPDRMLRELAGLQARLGFDGQAALEDHMGCGFGACLSCAVPLVPRSVRRGGPWPKPALQFDETGSAAHSLICRDGPVYDLREVDWDAWCA